LQFKDSPKYYDATDAVAVALCHFYQQSKPTLESSKAAATKSVKKKTGKKTDWADFIQKNPQRLVKK
jgi:crossover junction endodeoxyribonuclease RuvC